MQIKLRELTMDDINNLMNIFNRADIKYMPEVKNKPYSRKESKKKIKQILGKGKEPPIGYCRLVIVDDYPCGYIEIKGKKDIAHPYGEMKFCMMGECCGKGIMTQAVRMAMLEAFIKLEVKELIAKVLDSNEGAKRVLEKNDFEKIELITEEFENKELEKVLLYAYPHNEKIE